MNKLASNNKLIFRNTIYLSLRMFFVTGILLYTSRVILQVLGIEDFGIYSVVAGFVSMFAFLNTSLSNANQRFYNYELGKNGVDGLNNVYNVSIRIQACLSLIVIIFGETFGLWYLYEKMVIPIDRIHAAFWVFQFSLLSLVFLIFQIPYSAAIIAHEKMDFFAFVGVLDAVFKLFIALSIPYANGDTLIVYGFLILLISIIDWLLYYIYSLKKFKELKVKRQCNWILFKNMLSFSGWNFFGSFSAVMKEQGVNMVLNLFFGPVVNAARGIAYQVSGALQGVVQNVSVAARPQLTQSYAMGDYERTIYIMHSISKLCYLSLLCVSLPVILEIDYILRLWLGNTIPQHTNSFVILVIIASLIRVFHPMTSHVVHATGKMMMYQLTNGVLNLVLVPISYFLLMCGYNPETVFILFIIANIFIQICCWIILQTLFSSFSTLLYLKQVIFPSLIVTLSSVIIPYYAHIEMESGLFRLSVVTFFSVISILLFGFLLATNYNERIIVLNYIRKIVRK